MTNGYIVLTKGEPNLYKHAVAAIDLGKPVYYADGNKVAFVNSIELDSTNVIIKTSDKQITVTSDGSATEVEKGLYRYGAIFKDLNDEKTVTIFFKTGEKLADDLTFNDIKKYIFSGDSGHTGEIYDTDENVAYVSDVTDSGIDITFTLIADHLIDDTTFISLVSYELIAKIA